MRDGEVSVICVETPGLSPGGLDMGRVLEVAGTIGAGLDRAAPYHVVVIRSTVVPGTNQRVGACIEARSGKRRGVDFEVANVPEFQREGTAIADLEEGPLTVVGTDSDRAFAVVAGFFRDGVAPVRRADVAAVEMLKVVNNAWHALKVSFANEVGGVCKGLGIDSHAVMALFREDTKLNLSACYLKPGFAYGGSCLPKDLAALAALGRDCGVDLPVIQAIARSNASIKQRVIDTVVARGFKRAGIVGFSF
jgi:GDP-mannose 6-dehydrogenase